MPNVADIRYLFRFRDLVASTIEKHREVIRIHQRCWWGWWKRPTEGGRNDDWEALQREVNASAQLIVGLFDSGEGKVYAAYVTRVVPPLDDPNGTPPLPNEGEKEYVPEYYRQSPFSRAWMELSNIDPKPIDFFGSYSFAEAPPLPLYPSKVLASFRDKVIKSPDELRGMDVTIWRIRPRSDGDRDETIILTIPLLPSALSLDVRELKSTTILHITDPHFATGSNRKKHVWALESETPRSGPTLCDAISQSLNGRQIGLVVITGDFTFVGDRAEFKEASASVNRLLGLLNLDRDRLVIMPGNHDIQWSQNAAYSDDLEVKAAPAVAVQNYADFYQALFGHSPDSRLSMARRFILPSGIVLETCALNSSSLETGKSFLAGMGKIEEAAFDGIAKKFHWEETSASLRILALHHHLVLTENLEPFRDYYRGFGLCIDAPNTLRMAARNGVHLVLHGHKHRVFVWSSSVYELPEHTEPSWELGRVAVLGGGSAGSIETDSDTNYFNLIDVGSSKVNLTMFKSKSSGAFRKMAEWKAELSLNPSTSRLLMSDWRKI